MSSTGDIPIVLIIDDHEGQSDLQEFLDPGQDLQVKVLHPNDVDPGDLKAASLILVDYQLDRWPERDNLSTTSLKPTDGLALAAIFRRQLPECPVGIAIHTGEIDLLARPLPPEHREHVLARLNNLEWVFQKAQPGRQSTLAMQVYSLATGLQRLPRDWELPSADRPLGSLFELLSLDEKRNSHRFVDDVLSCRPPLLELSKWSHGLVIIRWLLHRILPYPCFLWDAHRIASRLRIQPKTVEAMLTNDGGLKGFFAPAEYKGVLSSFLGPRWWRCEIEAILWSETKGRSADVNAVHQLIEGVGTGLNPEDKVSANKSVICLDRNLRPLDGLFTHESAVRISPDDWPPYADQAWTTIELAQQEPLKSMAEPEAK
jgi:hypothetical protein